MLPNGVRPAPHAFCGVLAGIQAWTRAHYTENAQAQKQLLLARQMALIGCTSRSIPEGGCVSRVLAERNRFLDSYYDVYDDIGPP